MKKPRQYQFNKIDVDNNNEPVINEISEKDYINAQGGSDSSGKSKVIDDSFYDKNQISMKQALGIPDLKDDTISKRQKIFKLVSSIIFIVFVVAVLAWTAYNDFAGDKEIPPFSVVSDILLNNWYYLAFAVLSLLVNIFSKGSKLSIMCKSMTGKFRFWTCMETGILGSYYNNITPLAVGGQPFEIYHLSKKGVPGGVASSLPIATFFLYEFGFVFCSIVSLIGYDYGFVPIPESLNVFPVGLNILAIIGIVCCFIMPSLIILFSVMPSFGTSIVKFIVYMGSKFKIIKEPEKTKYHFTKKVLENARDIKRIAKSGPAFFISIILSLIENLSLITIAYFTLRFFGFDIIEANGIEEWVIISELCFLLYAAISFIPTPGNSGAADLSFYLLFESGLSSVGNVAFPAMLVWRFLSFYAPILIGFVQINISRKRSKKSLMK